MDEKHKKFNLLKFKVFYYFFFLSFFKFLKKFFLYKFFNVTKIIFLIVNTHLLFFLNISSFFMFNNLINLDFNDYKIIFIFKC